MAVALLMKKQKKNNEIKMERKIATANSIDLNFYKGIYRDQILVAGATAIANKCYANKHEN